MLQQELAHEELIRQMKLEQAKEITKLRQAFDLQVRELDLKYDKKMKILRNDMELRRKQEIHEIEERKNTHINNLMKKHETAFAEVKNYYNDITHNNLDLIRTLKEDVAEMKKKETQNEKLMFEIAQENKRLSDPLTKALKEVQILFNLKVEEGNDNYIPWKSSALFRIVRKSLRCNKGLSALTASKVDHLPVDAFSQLL